MEDTRLIFCRTPLQAVIVRAVQEIYPARDTVIYQPTSLSPKHRIYFDTITAQDKVFINWIDDRPSHFLKELRSYFTIPKRIRTAEYHECMVSSYDSLVFALLTRHRGARIRTFDDGMMSLLPNELQLRMEHEPQLHRRIKALFGARNTPELLAAVDRHYTIYDPVHVVFDRHKTMPIPLPFHPAASCPTQAPLTVMLGTPIALFQGVTTPKILDQYDAARRVVGCDIFIPHPAEKLPTHVADHVPDAAGLRAEIESRIAEDVIGQLYARGHRLTVYGIASSALVNIRSFAETRNIIIAGVNEVGREVFERLGVASVAVAELIEQ